MEHLYMSDSLFPSVLTHGSLVSGLFKHNGKSSTGRGLNVLLGTVICTELDKHRYRGKRITRTNVAEKDQFFSHVFNTTKQCEGL